MTMPGRPAWIGLGANLGEPRAQLQSAVAALAGLPGTTLEAVSRLYGSAPIGPADQPDYLNAAARLHTTLPPHQLLRELQAIEIAHDRRRERHWGPRTLDLDLLVFAGDEILTPELTVPHPELTRRAFVLLPLLDLDPALKLPDGTVLAGLLPGVAEQRIVSVAASGWWQGG